MLVDAGGTPTLEGGSIPPASTIRIEDGDKSKPPGSTESIRAIVF